MEIATSQSAEFFINNADVIAGVSTIRGGKSTGAYLGLNLGTNTDDSKEVVVENRETFFGEIFPNAQLCFLTQTHSSIVANADNSNFRNGIEADALFTFQRGKLLSVTVADCGNILIYQPGVCCAAVHAGWRGARDGILNKTITTLLEKGAELHLLQAFIGPMIRETSYEVGSEFAEYFPDKYLRPTNDRFHLDLPKFITDELKNSGITSIYDCGEDTFSSVGKYYSYRRSSITGRMSAFIGLR